MKKHLDLPLYDAIVDPEKEGAGVEKLSFVKNPANKQILCNHRSV